MSNSSSKVIKVSPYPITAKITGSLGALAEVKGRIVKLTMVGFLIEVPVHPFVVQEKYDVQFTLPVVGIDFKEPVIVMKSYDQFKGKSEEKAEIYRLVEFHFRSMKPDAKNHLESFLRQIGQLR